MQANAAGSIVIRSARPEDASLVHQFILELAAYEKLSHAVMARPDDIFLALFGPSPVAHCDIADLDGAPCGFALWFYNFSTFQGRAGLYLEDLYVRPGARGRGVGKALFVRLAQRCIDENLGRMDWAVLDWNVDAIAFYDSLGAEAKTEWVLRRLSGGALRKLAGC